MTRRPAPPRALLFDLDGTLVDTWRLYLDAFRHTLEPWFGRPLSDEDIIALNPSAERRLLERVVDAPRVPDYFSRFLAHYDAQHDRLFGGPYPGVTEMLAHLRTAGVRLGLVTGKSREAWRITAGKAGLGPFEVVVTDNEVKDPKPSPEGIRIALEALRLRPDDVLFIGDSLLDREAAGTAGVRFGAALWPKSPGDQEMFGSAARRGGSTLSFPTPDCVLALL
ncbi:HAD family hydrolase [Nitrospira sp. Kam-Ns4a]